MSKVIEKLQEMGYVLPEPVKPVASYVPVLQVNDLVFTSGNLPFEDDKIKYTGALGSIHPPIGHGIDAARLCTLNALSSIQDLIGDLDKISRIVKVTGYIKSAQTFTEQPRILNGASDFLLELFGKEVGSHVRSAIGVNELPLDSSVEVELIVQVKNDG